MIIGYLFPAAIYTFFYLQHYNFIKAHPHDQAAIWMNIILAVVLVITAIVFIYAAIKEALDAADMEKAEKEWQVRREKEAAERDEAARKDKKLWEENMKKLREERSSKIEEEKTAFSVKAYNERYYGAPGYREKMCPEEILKAFKSTNGPMLPEIPGEVRVKTAEYTRMVRETCDRLGERFN